MKRVLLALIAGTVLSGLAAGYACAVRVPPTAAATPDA